jgi:hypothetical protein
MTPNLRATRLILSCVCAVLTLALPGQVAAQSGSRPKVTLQCVSFGIGPMLECLIDLQRRDGTALETAQVTLGALMPSMPMAHTIRPTKAESTGKPGQYIGRLELEMLGVWSVSVDISGPVRDKWSQNLLIHDCDDKARCAATPTTRADDTPMGRHRGAQPGHRH